jgi:hypothetical protein
MTLGTADVDGRPWVPPVFFAAAPGWRELSWISSPEATHWPPGPGTKTPEDVLAPSLYRLYRATVSQ